MGAIFQIRNCLNPLFANYEKGFVIEFVVSDNRFPIPTNTYSSHPGA